MIGDLPPHGKIKYIDSVTYFPVNIKLRYKLNWDLSGIWDLGYISIISVICTLDRGH